MAGKTLPFFTFASEDIGNPHSYLLTPNTNEMRDKNSSVLFLNLLRSKVKWKLFYDAKTMFVSAF